jgi:hypothetical protein
MNATATSLLFLLKGLLRREMGRAPTAPALISTFVRDIGRGKLFVADIGQALTQFGDQRVVVGQDALQAVERVAQQRAGVAIPA